MRAVVGVEDPPPGRRAPCAIPSLRKLKELVGQDNVGTLMAALTALSEAAEPRVPPSPAARYCFRTARKRIPELCSNICRAVSLLCLCVRDVTKFLEQARAAQASEEATPMAETYALRGGTEVYVPTAAKARTPRASE